MTNSKHVNSWNVLLSKITSTRAKYKKIIIFGAAAFLSMIVLVYQTSLSKKVSEASHLAFKSSFDQWIAKARIDEQALKNLKIRLKKMPELLPLYQWKIIQHCLLLGDVHSASSLLKETKFYASSQDHIYFQRFSEISILVANKEYGKAYEESLLLKEDVLADNAFWQKQNYVKYGSDLFAYNLVRTAFLSKFLGKKELELSAWAEVKKYSSPNQDANSPHNLVDTTACKKLISSFSEEGLSIYDYINHRERFLGKTS